MFGPENMSFQELGHCRQSSKLAMWQISCVILVEVSPRSMLAQVSL